MVLKKIDSGPIFFIRMQVFLGFTEACNLQYEGVLIYFKPK
jgi:hypothetical protein